jgi:hypothetical protein
MGKMIRHRFRPALARYRRLCAGLRNPPEEFFCQAHLLYTRIVHEWEKPSSSHRASSAGVLRDFVVHLILGFVSLFTLLRARWKSINTAHYLIDIDNDASVYDFRSRYILEYLQPQQSINFFHTANPRYSIRTLLQHANAFYFESVYYWASLFLPTAHGPPLEFSARDWSGQEQSRFQELLTQYRPVVAESYWKVKVIRRILKFLRIRRFVLIDDSRHANELLLACRREGIPTLAYMHARFNEFFVGLSHTPFDHYLVWSEYFKKKLMRLNPIYRADQITVCGHPRLPNVLKAVPRDPNRLRILLVGESNIDYEDLHPFFDVLVTIPGMDIFFRGKPGYQGEFLPRHPLYDRLVHDNEGTLFDTLHRHRVGLVLATHSSILLESWLVGVPALMLNSSYDLAWDLYNEGLVDLCESPEHLPECIQRLHTLSDHEIEVQSQRIWGENPAFLRTTVEQLLDG